MCNNKRNSNLRAQYDFGAMSRPFAMSLIRNGFDVYETGGGCTAWRRDIPTGHYILLTSDATHIICDRDVVDVGMYDENGECILCVTGKLSDFAVAELVRDHVTDMPFSAALPDDVLDVVAAAPLGEDIIALCAKATAAIVLMGEHDLREQATAAVVRQCEVWLHG